MDSNFVGAIANSVTALVAIGAATIALLQFRHGQREVRATRTAELSWNIYLAYETEPMREGRRALQIIARMPPILQTAQEFGDIYRTRTYSGPRRRAVLRRSRKVQSNQIRQTLRYYHQVGVLLENRLIDADFIYPLIGHGIDSAAPIIKIAVEWYQNFYGGESGDEQAPKRHIYDKAVTLIDDYRAWADLTYAPGGRALGNARLARAWREM